MKEKFYITIEPIEVKASFSEPMYDEAPYLGSYSREVYPTIPKNTRLILDEDGFLEDVCGKNLAEKYGVSVHPGSLTFYDNLKDMIGTKIKIVSEEEWEKIWNQQCLYDENHYVWCEEMDTCENIDFYTKMDIAEVLEKPMISADEYEKTSAMLYENAFAYMKHLTLALNAAAKMREYRI